MPQVRALVVLLVASSAAAQPFARTVASPSPSGTLCVTWSTRAITYHVDAAGSARTPGDTEFTALDSAFGAWQAVADGCSDFRFDRGPRVTGTRVGLGTEDLNVLVFREKACSDVVAPADPCHSDGSCANARNCWEHSSGTIALTTSTFSTQTGVIYDSDIEFNAAEFLFTTVSSPPCAAGREAVTCVAYDVQSTATHEIGHVVGLDHVTGATSTMAPTAPLGETSKRAIDPGTALGFCATYPTGKPPVPCDQLAVSQRRINARSVGAPGCTCADSSGLGPFAPLVVLLGGRRRRRAQRRRVGARLRAP